MNSTTDRNPVMQTITRKARVALSLPFSVIGLVFFLVATAVLSIAEWIATTKPPPARNQVQTE